MKVNESKKTNNVETPITDRLEVCPMSIPMGSLAVDSRFVRRLEIENRKLVELARKQMRWNCWKPQNNNERMEAQNDFENLADFLRETQTSEEPCEQNCNGYSVSRECLRKIATPLPYVDPTKEQARREQDFGEPYNQFRKTLMDIVYTPRDKSIF